MRLGAKTDLMDEAWWLPSPRTGRFGQSTLDQARQRPRTIYVDAAGQRFVNESNSYMEVGKAMYARDKTSRAVPCWLIFDDRYRKRYAHLRSRPGRFPRQLLESGRLKQAWTLDDLAGMCGIDAAGLAETVEQFNEHAAQGRRPRLRAGRVGVQPGVGRPQPQGPSVPRSDRRAAVLRVRGGAGRHRHVRRPAHRTSTPRSSTSRTSRSTGLYATGNSTATVMGRHYLGPGASIANTHGVRLRRGPPRRATPRRMTRQTSVTPSRRTVMARVGHLPRRGDDLVLRRARRIDDERDRVVVEVERTRRLVHAVARAHAHVAVDLDFEAHGGRSYRTTMTDVRERQLLHRPRDPGRPVPVLRLGARAGPGVAGAALRRVHGHGPPRGDGGLRRPGHVSAARRAVGDVLVVQRGERAVREVLRHRSRATTSATSS